MALPIKRIRLLFVVNDPAFFRSHRLPIAQGALREGFDVWIASPPGPAVADLVAIGANHIALRLERASTNPISELAALASMRGVIATVRPDVLHLITIKPVLYGGIIARALGVSLRVSAISGLGYTFLATGPRAALMRRGVMRAFRTALGGKRSIVIFQNPDDRDLFIRNGMVHSQSVRMIAGSGVDLSAIPFAAENMQQVPLVLLPARMLWDKGVREFVEAAKIISAQGLHARFVLSGNTDDQNPAAVPEDRLALWSAEGSIDWMPHTTNIAARLGSCNLVVLPSYREGFPKTLIDAAAAGRAVVTTDVPGCRDAIIPERTGLLVPARDSAALARAIATLLNDPIRRLEMGRAARAHAEAAFDIRDTVEQHLALYRECPKLP